MRRFDRNAVTFGDRLIYRAIPEVPIRFKFMGHDGAVIVSLDDDYAPEIMPRDAILKQRDVALPD